LKHCDEEPQIPKTKDFVLPPKKPLVLPSQTIKLVCPCTPKHPHSHEQKFGHLGHVPKNSFGYLFDFE
jgi:hypothetical protein